jgi:translation initiation factor 1 (eIF-1/SUI1)
MNPFEQEPSDVVLNNFELNKIEIWCEERGRKCITHVYGWNINDTELKEHLRTIKKKKGCNGTIKKMSVDEIGEVSVLQLQGNHVDYVKEYIINISFVNIWGF